MNFFSALFVCSFFRLLLLFFSTLLRLDKTFVQKHWGAQMDSELNNILGKSINFTYCLYYWQYLFKENTPIFFRGGQRPRISVVRLFSTDKILRVTFCIKSFLTWEGGAYLSWCAIGSLFQKRDFVFQVWGGGHTWRRCRDRARRGGGEGRGAETTNAFRNMTFAKFLLNFQPFMELKFKKRRLQEKKNVPRVRIELTTFRLWDWRAAYCANEAGHTHTFQYNQPFNYLHIVFSIWIVMVLLTW